MTRDRAEQTIRELADRYSAAPLSMPEADLERLAEAIELLGQARVLEIAEKQRQSRVTPLRRPAR